MIVVLEKRRSEFRLENNQYEVLLCLNRCAINQMQEEVAQSSGLSRKTVCNCLQRLEQLQLVNRPLGERKGYAITLAGKEYLESI